VVKPQNFSLALPTSVTITIPTLVPAEKGMGHFFQLIWDPASQIDQPADSGTLSKKLK